ncbi:MAG: hypothetical protein ACI9EF_002941 [Pseudohongiellaceae bacterium]|jgi:hypothetical protein
MAARPDHPEPLPADSHTDPTPGALDGLAMASDPAAVRGIPPQAALRPEGSPVTMVVTPSPPTAPTTPQLVTVSTGDAALDELLGGGWPMGILTEVAGRGRTSLALGAVRAAQASGQPAAWVDGTGSFCPTTAGVDLESLAFVRPASQGAGRSKTAPRNQFLFAADTLLRSRAFALLVLDMPLRGAVSGSWFRLARLARMADTRLLLLHDQGRSLAGSAAALSLHVRLQPAPCPPWADPPSPHLLVSVQRHRALPSSQQREVLLSEQIVDPCSPA